MWISEDRFESEGLPRVRPPPWVAVPMDDIRLYVSVLVGQIGVAGGLPTALTTTGPLLDGLGAWAWLGTVCTGALGSLYFGRSAIRSMGWVRFQVESTGWFSGALFAGRPR